MSDTVWEFRTKNFKVAYEVEPEWDLDLSWDEDGSIREGLNSGLYVAFVAKVAVYWKGLEIGADYLGQCIYQSPEELRDHIGSKGRGSYFSDMVRAAIQESRKTLNETPNMRKGA